MSIEAMKQALEALEMWTWVDTPPTQAREAITTLRQAIEQAEQYPIGDAQAKLIAEQSEQWGASSVRHPDYLAEQKEKNIAMRKMLDQAQKQEHVIDCPRCGHCCPQAEQNRHTLQAKGEHPAPCARHCEANAFQIEIRSLKARIEQATCKQSLQVQQEPVAWLHTKLDGVVVPHRPADLDRHPDRWEGLHKTPPPCPTCEALARTVMLDQTSHDTSPPPRQPLTDEEEIQLIAELAMVDASASTNGFARLGLAGAEEALAIFRVAYGIKGEA